MMLDPHVLTTAAWLALASAQGAAPAVVESAAPSKIPPIRCKVPKAPLIRINLTTDPINYDFSRDSRALSAIRTDSVNPYAPGTDTATGGLRYDHPETGIAVKWGSTTYAAQNAMCLWYDEVDISIRLHPTIYLAKDFDNDICRKAILEHELKHIAVDHEVINDYGDYMGDAIRQTIDEAGAMGPYAKSPKKDIESFLMKPVMNTLHAQTAILDERMQKRQGAVDTLEEYQQVSKICDDAREQP